MPEAEAEEPALPEAELEEPILPEAESQEPALPEVEPEEPALPEAETEQPALPEAGAEQPTAPQITPPISAEGAAQEDEDGEGAGLVESEGQDTASLPDLSLFDTLPVTDAAAIVSAQEATTTELLTDEARDMQLRFPTQLTSEISYTDAATGLNVRYVLSGKTLSEYITLDSAPTRAVAYTVEISSDGLLPQTDADGRTAFVNAQGAEVFQLGSAVMFDAAGEQSGEIEAYLTATDADAGTYTYTLIPDLQWLQSADRQYPLSIDPDIRPIFEGNVEDTYISNDSKNSNYSARDRIKIGGTPHYRALIKITGLPELTAGDVILEATLNLSRYNTSSAYGKEIDLRRVLTDWDMSTVTWNSFSPDSATSVDWDRVESLAMTETQNQFNVFEITSLVKSWYETPASNYGMILQSWRESSNWYTEYRSSEYNSAYSGHPYFSIIYINSTGLEDRFAYHSQNAGRAGTGYVNDYSGNLTFTHIDAEINNGVQPISLSHVYNTNDCATDIGYGYG